MIPNSQIRLSARRLLGGSIFSSKWLMAMTGCLLYEFAVALTSSLYVGIVLLGALLCGVGTLFVAPYHSLSRALFYEAILRTEPAAQSSGYAAV